MSILDFLFNVIKETGKLGAKRLSRRKTERDLKNIHDPTFKKTGKDMEELRKKGRYVSGSQLYKRNKAKLAREAKQREKDRETFIDKL